jgi:steroid delta-isomerase-like uncharacterized protein
MEHYKMSNFASTAVAKWGVAWSSSSVSDFTSLFTEDCVYEDVAAKHIMRGKAELAGFFNMAREAFPDFAVTENSSVQADDKAAIEWLMTGTHQGMLLGMSPTNNKISIRGVSFIKLQTGLITSCTDYYDMATMVAQLGVTE